MLHCYQSLTQARPIMPSHLQAGRAQMCNLVTKLQHICVIGANMSAYRIYLHTMSICISPSQNFLAVALVLQR